MREAAKSRGRPPRSFSASLCRAAGFLGLGLALSACAGKGPPPPDKAIVTGSIPGSRAGTPSDETSDRDAVRAAVSKADAAARPAGIPWADPSTGTVGVITTLTQSETSFGTCRSFETSRHGYDGIALYVGEACQADDGPWRLIEFRPKAASATAPAGDPDGAPTG